MNFTTSTSKLKIEHIRQLTSHEPVNAYQIATDVGIERRRINIYISHLVDHGALVLTHKIGRMHFYKSTGVYYYVDPGRSLNEPVRTAPHVKPFRCEWTTQFFGPATGLHQKPEIRA